MAGLSGKIEVFMDKPTALTLFAGAGGFDAGFAACNVHTLAALAKTAVLEVAA